MKIFSTLVLLAICLISQSFLGFSSPVVIYPISDASEVDFPRHFRTVLSVGKDSPMNVQGLYELRISGSGQFSELPFTALINTLQIAPEKLIIIDLRQESHGFVNGKSVSWTNGDFNRANLTKTKAEIESDEYSRLSLAAQSKQILLDPLTKATKLVVSNVKTEKEIVENMGSIYVRLPVTDHCGPSNEVIDQFIEVVKNLKSDQWVHIHCRAGKGRTTTFLALFDMMKNAREVSLQDVLARQIAIGGSDLFHLDKPDIEKTQAAKERLEFIEKFYLYCQQVPDFSISWSEWNALHNTTEAQSVDNYTFVGV